MMRQAAAIFILLAAVSTAEAGGMPDASCKKIGAALDNLLEVNVKSKRAALKYQKLSMGLMADMFLISRPAYDAVIAFQDELGDDFTDASIDMETVMEGIRAFKALCPND